MNHRSIFVKASPLLLFFLPLCVFAKGPLVITDIDQANEHISDYLEIYVDSSNNLSINEINSERCLDDFITLSLFQEELDNSGAYWLHLTLQNKLGKSVPLGINIPNYNHMVDVYALAGGETGVQHTGFYRSGNKNDEIIPVTNIVQLPDLGHVELFISIRNVTDEKPVFGLELVDIRKEITRNLYKKIFDALLLGMMGLMIFYGLFLFFHHRDRIYLYYTFYIIFLCGWYFFCFEFGYSLVPGLPREIYSYSDIPAFIAFIFYLQFARAFLNIPEKLPVWNRILRIIQVAIILFILVYPTIMITTNRIYVAYLMNAGFFLVLVFIISALIIRLFRSNIQFSNVLAIGTSFLLIGIVISLSIYLLKNDNSMIYQKLGTILELVVFTYGISLRYRVLEDEKRLFQKQVIEQLEENTRIQEKANRELEGKVRDRTREISEKNDILIEQNEEIKAQSDLLFLQHESIQESIRYASRIQSAILPAAESLQHFLPKHFILFKPRDIVSGDFYWLGSKEDKIIIAAVDCTGHGVPGAFMSMLGSSLLNQIVNSLSSVSANDILDELRDRIILALKQTGKAGETKDGMDMGLCIIDRINNTLEFSGSNNNLIIIRKGELIELKGDRMPIGISHLAGRSFSKQVFDLKKGDSIYLHSDGFPDQFGGPKGKKFLTAKFKQLLLDIQEQIMYEQKESLERSLHEWMNPSKPNTASHEQVDDILVIGIRI